MSSATFEERMRKEIGEIAARLSIANSSAFAVWYAAHILRLEETEAVEATTYDGGNDYGIDLFVVDDELERVVIGQTRFYESSNKAPKAGDLAHLLDTVDELEDPQEFLDAGRPDLAEASLALAEARNSGYTVQLQFIHSGRAKDDLDRKVRQFNRKRGIDGITASVICLDDLDDLATEISVGGARVPEATINLKKGTFHEERGKYGRSLVATISGSELKRLHSTYGKALFDQNVRLFLGARKGSVNAEIKETINSPDERTSFWAYNNGITVVTSTFEVEPDVPSVKVFDFSVVNGCQTTVSIAEASDTAASEVAVLARIVAAKPELVDRIIRYTNSQTPINVWDLSARDKVQQRLKRELDELDPPWFYALRRGEFDGLDDKTRYGKRGERRVLAFPLSAQYLAAFKGLPVEAYKDKARIFTTHKDRVFPPDVSAADLLWAWKVGESAERAVAAYRSSVNLGDVESQVLKRGARLFATAVAGQLLRARNGEDFVAGLDPSRLNDRAMTTRIDKYTQVAVSYYVSIVSDLVHAGNDLGVILRNTDTADRIRQRVEGRLFEERQAPRALDEKLPLLPGVTRSPTE